MARDYIEWQIHRALEHGYASAVVWRNTDYNFREFTDLYQHDLERLRAAGIVPGSVVALTGEFSPVAISCLLALAELNCIVVPLSKYSESPLRDLMCIAEADYQVAVSDDDDLIVTALSYGGKHPLIERLRDAGQSGLVLFSSGSTGTPKAILHALPQLLAKFRNPRPSYRTLAFLVFDHIGGLNTVFHTLANLGCVVIPEERTVAGVCRAIERHKVELLPASPSFLNLIVAAKATGDYDLSSLKLITYGSEVMPQRTLDLLNDSLPDVKLQQTYGLSEVGILRSRSPSNRSLFVKVGGEHYDTKIVDGTLRVRSACSMLGYLNAPNPFDDDGWFDTGDAVEQVGEYYRILGRVSDIINVGGQKVYPAQVEKVIRELPELKDVCVSGEPDLLLGQVVVARVEMSHPEPAAIVMRRIRDQCRGRLQPFMIPVRVRIQSEPSLNHRFKTRRS